MTLTTQPEPTHTTVLIADGTETHDWPMVQALANLQNFTVFTTPLNKLSVESEVRNVKPEVLLLHATGRHDRNSQIELMEGMQNTFSTVKCVLVTEVHDLDFAVTAFHSGLVGLLSEQQCCLATLRKCLACVQAGQVWISTAILAKVLKVFSQTPLMIPAPQQPSLSRREQEVMELVLQGLSNREIADTLNVSENTVKKYVYDLFNKIGVSNRVELVLRALPRGRAA